MQTAEVIKSDVPEMKYIFVVGPCEIDLAAWYGESDQAVQIVNIEPESLRQTVLTGNAFCVHVVGFFSRYVAEIQDTATPVVWDLRNCAGHHIREKFSGPCGADARRALAAAAVVLIGTNEAAHEIEKLTGISITPEIPSEQVLRLAHDPVLIGIGAGMGNIIETTPLLKAVAEAVAHPIDVYVNSPVPGVEVLLGRSPYIHRAFSSCSQTRDSWYRRVFITASAGHVIPPVHCDIKRVQRRKYEMMHECRLLHESEFNFLGAEEVFPELTVPFQTWQHFFVSNLEYNFPNSNVVGICDGKVPGKWQLREWSRFDELVPALQSAGYEVRSFGVKGQYVPGTVDKTGTSLREAFGNLTDCSYFIASDGGLAHVAEALGIPTIVLFGPTSIVKNGPIAPWARAITSDAACSPCQWKTDFHDCRDNICMKNISVQEVMSVLKELGGKLQAGNIDSLPPARRFYRTALQRELSGVDSYCREESLDRFLEQSFSSYPDAADFYMRAAQGNMRFGRLERAGQIIERGRTKFPDDFSLRRLDVELLFREQDYERAVCLSEQLLEEHRTVLSARILHSRILVKLENWREVASQVLTQTRNANEDAELAWLIGYARRELADWKGTREAFLFSLNRRPGVERVADALGTLDASVYQQVSQRGEIESQRIPRVAIISDSPQPVAKRFAEYRSVVHLYLFTAPDLDTFTGQEREFSFIWIQGSADFCRDVLSLLPTRLLPRVVLECPELQGFKKYRRNCAACIQSDEDAAIFLRDQFSELLAAGRNAASGRYSGKRFVICAHHHLSRWSPHGGEKSMKAIADYLLAEGAELLVVVANMKTPDVLCEVHEGISYVVASKWRYIDVLRQVFIAYQPDVSLTWGPQSLESGPLAASLNIPYVLFVRYWKVVQEPPYDSESLNGPTTDMEMEKYGPLYQHASAVITNGKYVTDVVDRKYGVRSEVAYVPVAPPPADYVPPARSERPFVTLVNPRKAKGELIIQELARRLPQMPFKVIGEPSISLPANVTVVPYFSGHYTEMLKDSRVLLFPWGEVPCGTGRVVFEAHYAGVPVVSVDTGGMYEVLPAERLVSHNDAIDEWVSAVENAYTLDAETLYADLRQLAEAFPEDQGKIVLDTTLERLVGKDSKGEG